ncbi:uncharacterized protein [Zea mays]|uniref:Uncharacterized protein n=2 Tax=Zea mays TaxID=4577 RepID=A0A1D6GVY9_MAIZE|nr:uncharacterized protein LOC103626431 [Zea mays]AQK67054.1 hypothetical protein ZEAMMB73_Zm00001d014739 [Zea mays]AQK67057.1 hypothetical protein ZEAMMB73_Zm00001d014739 [Zea mays]AQK67060.1 hypothetical protein ZEAMMB73_Zm00001d014739 [Zea mays]AQK67070.1 hypothetical protein ZEAMMB73_Zm00001d014739 [Zea mays]AQK67077.1 hypothetical protein ZEAMMB73_Zm00001d014739 [Zea mays]|eukprot:XP_008645063.1 uncharacterized protein LOC103626431 isoform X1 [Zea mays]
MAAHGKGAGRKWPMPRISSPSSATTELAWSRLGSLATTPRGPSSPASWGARATLVSWSGWGRRTPTSVTRFCKPIITKPKVALKPQTLSPQPEAQAPHDPQTPEQQQSGTGVGV